MFEFDDGALFDQELPQTTDPVLLEMRRLSHAIAPLRQRVRQQVAAISDADATVDFDQLTADTAQLEGLHSQLIGAIQLYKASPAYQADAQTAALLDNWLSFAGAWAKETAAAVAGILPAVAAYLGKIVTDTGKEAVKALSPLLIGALALGAVVLFAVKRAERTRTYKRYVA